jgi:hypothetical protein
VNSCYLRVTYACMAPAVFFPREIMDVLVQDQVHERSMPTRSNCTCLSSFATSCSKCFGTDELELYVL